MIPKIICPSCLQAAEHPFRIYREGTDEIQQGCVDDCHTAYLNPWTADHAWHWRIEASSWRAAQKSRKAASAVISPPREAHWQDWVLVTVIVLAILGAGFITVQAMHRNSVTQVTIP